MAISQGLAPNNLLRSATPREQAPDKALRRLQFKVDGTMRAPEHMIHDRFTCCCGSERGFEKAVSQARALTAAILKELHVNRPARQRERWKRQGGSIVVIVSNVGDLGTATRKRGRGVDGRR